MKTENFVYFFTVCGFFIGLIFSILKFSSAFDIGFYTLVITLFFYLFIHFVLTYFIQTKEIGDVIFNKKQHEQFSNQQILEIEKKEDKITKLLKSINKINQNSN